MDYRYYLQTILRCCLSRDYLAIRRRRIFDPHYYAFQVPECSGESDPLWHYCSTGPGFYRRQLKGHLWRKFAEPHPLFDTSYYLRRYFPHGLEINPFAHYLTRGWRLGFWPGPFLDPETYRKNSDWKSALGDPLTHYTCQGAARGISPGPFFDVAYYLDRNPVMAGLEAELIRRYREYGAPDGKSPVPGFDPRYYLETTTEPEEAAKDPFSHYASASLTEELRPCRWFDPSFYRQQMVPGQECHPLADYLTRGVRERRPVNRDVAGLPVQPRISILVPVYNPQPHFLRNCIRSVVYQSYSNWQLCLADDCSSEPYVTEILHFWAAHDERIKVTRLEKNSGISAATNRALELADGEYCLLLDNDDELASESLFHLARCLIETEAEVVYGDEDLIGDDGRRFEVFYKPAFNRELLLSHNYITHPVAVRTSLLRQLGGLRSAYDGAQDYDLMLRLAARGVHFHHLPRVLYHWRASESSTSINHSQKHYAHEAGRKALAAHLKQTGSAAKAVDGELNFFYRVDHQLTNPPAVTVVVDGRVAGDERQLEPLCRHIGYEPCELVVFTPEESEQQPSCWTQRPVEEDSCRAKILHEGIMAATNSYVAILDPCIERLEDNWLQELVGWAQGERAAVVCGRLDVTGDDRPSYTLPRLEDRSGNYMSRFLQYAGRHQNGLHCTQRISCCHWDFVLLDRQQYLDLGGFHVDAFGEHLAMVDLSLRASQEGRKVIYTPHALAHRSMSSPEPVDPGGADREWQRFRERWRPWLAAFDPYYNPGVLARANIKQKRFVAWLCDPPTQP